MSASKKSTIANNIKKYRTKLGVSQDRLSKIANALGVSVDDLIK